MIDFWKSAMGMYRVQVTSASIEQCFDRINSAGIRVFEVCRKSELTASFLIMRGDREKLKWLCEKHGDSIELCGEVGIYHKCRKMVKRPVLILGVVLIFVMTLLMPRRVLFIQVEGNREIPDSRILEAAQDCGIQFGASRESVRSEQVKNGLLSLIPELKWAGVNTKGCVAVISVREGAKTVDIPDDQVSSILAVRDGVVTSCTATRGNLLCREGQVVKKGQVLISAYTDCGISIQATRAEGEIYAQTVRDIRAVKPLRCLTRLREGEPVRRFSILVGKKRINLWKGSGIRVGSCGRMYQEYYLILPGHFRLPLALCVETVIPYDIATIGISSEGIEDDLYSFSKEYLLRDMVAGTIQSSRTNVIQSDDVAFFDGTFLCEEMIGRMKTEQIGEWHGKTN